MPGIKRWAQRTPLEEGRGRKHYLHFCPSWEICKIHKAHSTCSFIQWAHPCAKLPTGDKMINHCPYLHRAGRLVEGTDTYEWEIMAKEREEKICSILEAMEGCDYTRKFHGLPKPSMSELNPRSSLPKAALVLVLSISVDCTVYSHVHLFMHTDSHWEIFTEWLLNGNHCIGCWGHRNEQSRKTPWTHGVYSLIGWTGIKGIKEIITYKCVIVNCDGVGKAKKRYNAIMNLDLDSSKFLRGMDQKVRAISGWIFRFGLMNRYGSGKAFLIRWKISVSFMTSFVWNIRMGRMNVYIYIC